MLQVIVAALRATEGGEGDRPRPAKAGRQVIRSWEKLGTVKDSKQAPAGKGLNYGRDGERGENGFERSFAGRINQYQLVLLLLLFHLA